MDTLLGFLTLGFYFFFLITQINKGKLEGKIEINCKNKNKDKGFMEYLHLIEEYLFALNYKIEYGEIGKKVFRERGPEEITLIWDTFHIEILGPPFILENICEILELEERFL